MTTTKIGMEWMKIERTLRAPRFGKRSAAKRVRGWKDRYHKEMRNDAKSAIRE